MSTDVPPPAFPVFGLIEVIVGRIYENALSCVALVPLALVTPTLTTPAAWAGVVTEIDVSVAKVVVPGTPPKVTAAPEPKPVPDMNTRVPPAVLPEMGLMDVIAGRTYANPPETV
jgi:hypothetical protein